MEVGEIEILAGPLLPVLGISGGILSGDGRESFLFPAFGSSPGATTFDDICVDRAIGSRVQGVNSTDETGMAFSTPPSGCDLANDTDLDVLQCARGPQEAQSSQYRKSAKMQSVILEPSE